MSPMSHAVLAELTLEAPEQTARLAQLFAGIAQPGDILLLSGSIGAGKTHFARSLIQKRMAEFGVVEDVPSPTFTLVQTYEAGALEIWHSDLYRLTDTSELEELGLFEAFETALVLIEWPDRLGGEAPGHALSLMFETMDNLNARRLTISGDAQLWGDRLNTVFKNEFTA